MAASPLCQISAAVPLRPQRWERLNRILFLLGSLMAGWISCLSMGW